MRTSQKAAPTQIKRYVELAVEAAWERETTPVRPRHLGRVVLGAVVATAAIAAATAGVLTARGPHSNPVVALDPGNQVSSPAPPASSSLAGSTLAQSDSTMTLADAARLSGYRLMALPSSAAKISASDALAAVKSGDYVVGVARLGLLQNDGAQAPSRYHWQRVWVVVSKPVEGNTAVQPYGASAAPSGVTRGIFFVDASTGAQIRSVLVPVSGQNS